VVIISAIFLTTQSVFSIARLRHRAEDAQVAAEARNRSRRRRPCRRSSGSLAHPRVSEPLPPKNEVHHEQREFVRVVPVRPQMAQDDGGLGELLAWNDGRRGWKLG
jgi:hypothetical protein